MSAARPRDRRSLIDAFIILNVVAIGCWSIPIDSALRTTVNQLLGGYVRFTGLWQHWDMFSPEPRSILIRMDATVTLRDGTKKTWVFPQMDELSLWQKFQKERYRKWAHDNVRLDQNSFTWYPTAQYIARQCSERDNPATSVELYRYWKDIPLPDDSGMPVDFANIPFERYTFYQTDIDAGDLQ